MNAAVPANSNMTDSKAKQGADSDQSMEEILQSIRRIIAEESDDASPADKPDFNPADIGSDVLELTDMVDENANVVSLNASEAGMDVLSNIDKAIVTPPASAAPSNSLLSEKSTKAAVAALKTLTGATPAEVPMKTTASPAFRSGNTVEDLTMELLRPMLKEWLDTNLPSIVERIVTKEVKKLTSGAMDD